MCGICGCFSFNGLSEQEIALTGQMVTLMERRGPDDQGQSDDRGAGIRGAGVRGRAGLRGRQPGDAALAGVLASARVRRCASDLRAGEGRAQILEAHDHPRRPAARALPDHGTLRRRQPWRDRAPACDCLLETVGVRHAEAGGGALLHRPARAAAGARARVEAHPCHDHVDVVRVRVDGDPAAGAALAPVREVA